MNERILAELELVQSVYPDVKQREEGGVSWLLIRDYAVPCGWSVTEVDVAFQMPAQLPVQKPYAFWVRPAALTLEDGTGPQNVSGPVPTPFGEDWLQFSWELDPWLPGADPRKGTNMLDFARSFRYRFLERS